MNLRYVVKNRNILINHTFINRCPFLQMFKTQDVIESLAMKKVHFFDKSQPLASVVTIMKFLSVKLMMSFETTTKTVVLLLLFKFT